MSAAADWQAMRLTGWGRLPAASVQVTAPQDAAGVGALLRSDFGGSIVPRGGGRSYGDQALLAGGKMVLTRRLQHCGDFDATTSEVTCESGVRLRDILERFLPQGLLLPVSPGTGYVTVGGAIANDVHGKNHERHGSFGQHVNWLDLVLPTGELLRASPTQNSQLFAATVGGMGLTGIIVRAGLQLMPVRSNAVTVNLERVPNVGAFLDRFEEIRRTATYSVAWIDAFSRGGDLGRGILETAELSDDGVDSDSGGALRMPCDLPSVVLNRWSMRAFNEIYFRRVPRRGRIRPMAIHRFLYPLDAIADWNRMYGRRGFFQFQCVLPDAESAVGLRRLLETIAESGAGSFLAVLKTLGGDGAGMLSFPMRGYTLALDFPNRPGVRNLLARLEAITLEHAGRVYLAKDATLSAPAFCRMYARLGEFRRVLEEIDPRARMTSDMAIRLKLRSAACAV